MQDSATWIAVLSLVSVTLMTLTVVATPWLVARLPQNYFASPKAAQRQRGVMRIVMLLARNLAGGLFLLLGVVMLVTPGPGLIGILLGLVLCEFPGRHALIRRLVAHPPVYRSLNWMRRRQHKPPFDAP